MRILVTGAAGFIGRHLATTLHEAGHHVDTLDLKAIDRTPPQQHFVADAAIFSPSHSENWDRIYHLASPVGPVGVLGHGGRIAPSIVDGVYNMLRIAAARNARLLYVSSSEVYGPRPDGDPPLREDMASIVPTQITHRLEYGVAKLCAEIMATNLSRRIGAQLRIVRLFNTIGEGQDPAKGFVVARFMQQALAQKPITVYGDGTQIRAFTNVQDVIEAMQTVMESGSNFSIYNVGNPSNVVTILALAKMIKSATGSTSEITFVDPQELHGPAFAEAWNKIPDIAKLSTLGWKPKYSLPYTITKIAKAT